MKSLIAGIVVAGACAVASADEAEILEIELRLMGGLRAADALPTLQRCKWPQLRTRGAASSRRPSAIVRSRG